MVLEGEAALDEKGLPSAVDAERMVLGAVLLDDACWPEVAGLPPADFTLESSQLISAAMAAIYDRHEHIDTLTVADQLGRTGGLGKCGGLTYLSTLDTGMPAILNVSGWVHLVGEKARLRRLVFIGQALSARACLASDTAQDICDAVSTQLITEIPTETSGLVTAVSVIAEYPGGINKFFAREESDLGLQTQHRRYNQLTGGLHKGELIIIGARPRMGKSGLSANWAHHLAVDQHKSVAIFSMEMNKEELVLRMSCSDARVSLMKVRANYLNQEDRRRLTLAASRLHGANLFIDDRGEQTVLDIFRKCEALKRKEGLDLVIIDYLSLLADHVKNRRDNRVVTIGDMTRFLKIRLAKDLQIPVVLLSQLSRAPDLRPGNNHRPQLSDLRESGSIEMDADGVAFIYRPELYGHKRNGEDQGKAELIIAKQRNGPEGVVHLAFLKDCVRFEDLAEGRDPEESEH